MHTTPSHARKPTRTRARARRKKKRRRRKRHLRREKTYVKLGEPLHSLLRGKEFPKLVLEGVVVHGIALEAK